MLSIVSESYGFGWENTSYMTEILELFLKKFTHKNLAMMQKLKYAQHGVQNLLF
jgi:hypothetical protein